MAHPLIRMLTGAVGRSAVETVVPRKTFEDVIAQRHLEEGIRDVLAAKPLMQRSLAIPAPAAVAEPTLPILRVLAAAVIVNAAALLLALVLLALAVFQ